ncbi:prolipoprotein diacylglyceryl transferase [Lichenicola cladoniae]|uniref:Phosphatidylglycerol--prolipoprotein diacylglyceryl transferase n=1 Tax=Lichenicola cladoniae TaxID=1484109 RepID=A0A6M8HT83_9PROT|nr:prolipoprotein diacylglyceryl transferase [Lichenicola cladoniae]NPD65505.1 prolipoprotein diacylglyceryl transferase [Acetobacteraceae bacterium]QKE91435.1 prolipoprotein diacylglyceryl transferase [Lichenicola cladoniae]
MFPVLVFPEFDPVLVQFGPLAIRWYALAYITALVIGWRLMRRLAVRAPAVATPLQVDDFLTWATLGVVLGGRFGYILFYQPGLYFSHPLAMLELWHGGMSFHGGMLGVVVALIVFTRRRGINLLGFADRLAVVVPVGLGLGRLANFINGELWGRPADPSLPWAMIFPRVDAIPRHPSEIYEALMEGVLLLCVMLLLARRITIRERAGLLTGIFLLGYAILRAIGEHFRQPDSFLNYLAFGTTMGQLLCIPMAVAGIALIVYSRRQPKLTPILLQDAA